VQKYLAKLFFIHLCVWANEIAGNRMSGAKEKSEDLSLLYDDNSENVI